MSTKSTKQPLRSQAWFARQDKIEQNGKHPAQADTL